MKIKDGKFHFKQFAVCHLSSSMKVGVDGVLVGAWADCNGSKVLDVGTGCGLIALMIAQRNPYAMVSAIDIDEGSVIEAKNNFAYSPWSDRLSCRRVSFSDLIEEAKGKGEKFDRIISNPPYFDSGVQILDDPRKLARHYGELSPEVLLRDGKEILSEGGRIAMVLPYELRQRVVEAGQTIGLHLSRCQRVRNHEGAPVKRVLVEFSHADDYKSEPSEEQLLTMFKEDGEPTDVYRKLCGDFYLKF